jgi:hypothetical protein
MLVYQVCLEAQYDIARSLLDSRVELRRKVIDKSFLMYFRQRSNLNPRIPRKVAKLHRLSNVQSLCSHHTNNKAFVPRKLGQTKANQTRAK